MSCSRRVERYRLLRIVDADGEAGRRTSMPAGRCVARGTECRRKRIPGRRFDFSAFKSGRNFTPHGGGGLITRTPHDFVIPRGGHGYIVAHTWGLRNTARVSVRHLPQLWPMSPATPHIASDIADVARNAAIFSESEASPVLTDVAERDVFICHASEDKETVVRPLHSALVGEGLDVLV